MCKDRKRKTFFVSATVDPKVLAVIKTYSFGSGCEVVVVPEKDGHTDLDKAKEMMADAGAASLLVAQPNYYGLIEDVKAAVDVAHEVGAKAIVSCNPFALTVLQTPAEAGADVAVGEAQPLGLPLAFGGPYIGFMACTHDMMRKLPGRIVGQTEDDNGNRAFVLTLQAREQHIRREKASSNICSNEALCAMTVAVYLAAMGKGGVTEVAKQCVNKAHYLQKGLAEAGLGKTYEGEFFHEFVTTCKGSAEELADALEKKGYLAGLPISEHELLWCATEMNTKEQMDEVIALVKEVQA